MFEMMSPFRCSLVLQRVLDGEQAAPRLSEQVEVVLVEAERLPHLLDLVDEARQLQQSSGIVRLVAVGRAELVVVVVLDAGAGEVAVERLEVLVGRPRARRAAAAP